MMKSFALALAATALLGGTAFAQTSAQVIDQGVASQTGSQQYPSFTGEVAAPVRSGGVIFRSGQNLIVQSPESLPGSLTGPMPQTAVADRATRGENG